MRSSRAVLLLVAAAGFSSVAAGLAGLAYLLLSYRTVGAFEGLATASEWVGFVALGVGLAAVATTFWAAVVTGRWQRCVELGGAAVASLLIAIGSLVTAASGPAGSGAGSVVVAVGVGGWMALCLVTAGRRSIAEQRKGARRCSDLWLVATGGLLVLAVATGLPSAAAGDQALAVAGSVLALLAYASIAAALELAGRRGDIASPRLRLLVVGLLVVAGSYLVGAVADGFVFAPSAGLGADRVGLSVPELLQAGGWAVVALAAFGRLADLLPSPGGAVRVVARADLLPPAGPDAGAR